MDLHLHTPASSDYQQPEVSYLKILQQAETRDLDVIAFTDHNTVAGYRRMQEEIQQLEMLKDLDRLLPEEKSRLNEYHRLIKRILVLPGFEFTATFGFHILAIFSPDTPVREIEHILLDLNIPADQLDQGAAAVGASADVLAAYEKIRAAGGLAIAAHANSTNGVAMRGFRFGGQTKIAYTQDKNLSALEVTDLDRKGRHSTSAFFSGSKPEYPRRMHCIQGSDAHRLDGDPKRHKNLGVGDRSTDVRLPEVSFHALVALFDGNDFARTRPHRTKTEPAFDFIQAAVDDGANIVQDFHESMTVRGGKLYAIIADVCAFANTNGGTLYIGISADQRKKSTDSKSLKQQDIDRLVKEISDRISPPLTCNIDLQKFKDKSIIRILIPVGDDPPYAVDESKIYLRTEAETGMAVRDEIVEMVMRGQRDRMVLKAPTVPDVVLAKHSETEIESAPSVIVAPRTGVEIVAVEERQGVPYYTVRDLRNGNMVKNVTKKSARHLWQYALTQHKKLTDKPKDNGIKWQGDLGFIKRQNRGNYSRYDLVQRDADGNQRYYFGVTDDGIHGAWKKLVGIDEDIS